MERFFLALCVLLSVTFVVRAEAIVDNFDLLDTSFWNCDVNLTRLVSDPDALGSHGSVLQIMGYSGVVNHTFEEAVYGTISLDYYDNDTEPKQRAVFGSPDASLTASSWIGRTSEGESFIPTLSGNMAVEALVNRFTGWHTLSLVYGINSTSAYVDGVLTATSDFGGGCSNIYFRVTGMVQNNYFDDFSYTPAIVPEPSTYVLVLSGLFLALGAHVRKRYYGEGRG